MKHELWDGIFPAFRDTPWSRTPHAAAQHCLAQGRYDILPRIGDDAAPAPGCAQFVSCEAFCDGQCKGCTGTMMAGEQDP